MDTFATPRTPISRGRIFHRASTDMSIRDTCRDDSLIIAIRLAEASRIAMIRLSSRQVSLIDMSVLARWKIRPRLMGVHGVANVAIYGQRDRQLQVQVDPRQLRTKDVSLTQVIE